jgi:hypothetical protein
MLWRARASVALLALGVAASPSSEPTPIRSVEPDVVIPVDGD